MTLFENQTLPASKLSWQLCVAPMMDWTDRHCRYFHRLLAPKARLYTEMVTTGALLHGNRARHLDFDPAEHPVALQLGGNDPAALAHCARLAQDWGYDEVNLNCGCPSPRVRDGAFGACLMQEPARVARAVSAMREACDLPVTVKHRIGVDDQADYGFVRDFVGAVAQGGCEVFIVHARAAWLQGLSPKENRSVPPLNYDTVRRLTQDFPELLFVLNGGLDTVNTVLQQLPAFAGVMIGRAAYQQPSILLELSAQLWPNESLPNLESILADMGEYAQAQSHNGVPTQAITRHILGLMQGRPGARRWRQILSDSAYRSYPVKELFELAGRHSQELERTP